MKHISKAVLRTISLASGIAVAGLGGGLAIAGGTHSVQRASLQEPDNTATNKGQAPTADNQKETAEDRELAKKIRHAIMEDKSLSVAAHNVKVIVRNGNVTLRGPVNSEDEKRAVAAKATELAGAQNVQNDITVKP